MINKILGIGCFLSPFLIGFGIWNLLNPIGYWQSLATFLVILIICFFEGILSWAIGLALWEVN